MEADYNFKPKSESDRHRGSYEPVPGSERDDGNFTKTMQRVSVQGGAAASQLSVEEETLLYLKAMVLGLSMITNTDLLQEVINDT